MSNSDLTSMSLVDLVTMIRQRQISSREVVSSFLARIEKYNPALNAIVTINEQVIEQAAQCDTSQAHARKGCPLFGVPITVKDTIKTAGIRTTAGSKRLKSYTPSRDATAIRRLREAGALVLGKTNVPEIAMTYESENLLFGRTRNPFSSQYTAGGSSGGEAAAIAARLSPAGIGSDLSGSIRIPANFCGLMGLKPGSGMVPADGHLPPARGALSLGSTIGPMGRTSADLKLLYTVLSGGPAKADSFLPDPREWSIGWFGAGDVEALSKECQGAVKVAVEIFQRISRKVTHWFPEQFSDASGKWTRLFARAAALWARDTYGGHEQDAGAFVRYVIDSFDHETAPSLDSFLEFWSLQDRSRSDLLDSFSALDFIIAPVGATPAFQHGARKLNVEGREFGMFRAFGPSQIANVFGLPSIAVPTGLSDAGLPLGIQLIGKPEGEYLLLQAAGVIERELDLKLAPRSGLYP